jgi:ferredoxin
MDKNVRKHPLNVKGKYYILGEGCACSGACEMAAPDIFKDGSHIEYGFYVARQPATPEEEDACVEAMMCCPFEAIFDDGEKF